MALFKIVNTSNASFVAMKTELTAKDIKTAMIANPLALVVFNKDGEKEFEFDLAPEGGVTVISNLGIVVPTPKLDTEPITHMFCVEDEDKERVVYVAAICQNYMDAVERQVKACVKRVRSVKIKVENLADTTGE